MASDAKSVYVLYGNDQFLLDAHRKEIVSRTIGDADPQLSLSQFDATAELADVLNTLRTLPFLAARRVVIVRDADAFISANREAMEEYLKAPSETAVLVLMVGSWPKGARLYKLVAEFGEAIECSLDQKASPARWLRQAAVQREKKLAPDAAELLIACKGNDLAALDGEVEKLSLYVGQRETITVEDVSTLVISTAGVGAFDVTNAVSAGDSATALKALARAVTRRGEEFRVLGMIAWHLRKVLKVKRALEAGRSAQQACRNARVFGNQREFVDMVRRRSMRRIEEDFRGMLRADLAMKTGADPTTALQKLVVELCS